MSSSTQLLTGFSEEREAFESALSDADGGTRGAIAVLSEPFGGRERFLDVAADKFGERATRIRCGPTMECSRGLDLGDGDVVIVDDCQHLFVRRIGGFDGFDRFLRQVATFDGLVVTSWNTYSWDYLVAVKDLERTFPTQIRLGHLDREYLQVFLLAENDDVPELVDDRGSIAEPLLVRRDYPLSFGRDRKLHLPYVVPNVDEIVRRVTKNDGEPVETLFFERLTQVADGNPGVARYLWEERISDGRLEFSALREPDGELGLDYDTAFLLQVLLTKERISYDELYDVVAHPDLDRALGQLVRQQVLTVDGDLVELRPATLKQLVESLERRRIIW
ncbi:hypothetical protein [Haloarchaeobius sp. TZWWS8]|uniref:hypothetical protein n=1 Tax=Haloarchaeobius sp. TZWWS8 TaxID=3446121 RepID=UPI003EC132F8